MLVQMTLEKFNGVLGSDAPAPGGGSVAALSGALGAELVTMVCRLSVGRDEFKQHEAAIRQAIEKGEKLAKSLLNRVDLDTEAFNAVMAAFKLPKATDAEKENRKQAIQAGYKEAIQSPLAIARECLNVLRLAEGLLGASNENALSDLGVAALQAQAGLEGAIMNVKINIPSIKDESFVAQTNEEVAALLDEGGRLARKNYEFVSGKL